LNNIPNTLIAKSNTMLKARPAKWGKHTFDRTRQTQLYRRTFFLQGATMSLRLNDTAPDFTAETTQGKINFHDWVGDQWAILFSHPKDFTPVCTTELGYMAGIESEFTKRNCKLIGLSIDPVDNHAR
jgi:hypothetical protein